MTFLNFETNKLLVQHPTINNILILLFFCALTGITFRRRPNVILDRTQSDQLKGIAILLVVTGHLWLHVSLNNAIPNLAGEAVALFLLLSGFGLTRSWQKKPLSAPEFVFRRMSRVMIPYWLATISILLLDGLLLGKLYSANDIISTCIGVNFAYSLRFLDYARWYITLLLIFYVVFFLANKFLRSLGAVVGIFVFSLFLFVLRRIDLFPFGALFHFLAFPLGCLIGCFYDKLLFYLSDRKKLLSVLGSGLVGSFVCQIFKNYELHGAVGKLVDLLTLNSQPLFLCLVLLCVIGLLGTYGLYSKFLGICGMLSYEVYLIHGPLLIKYNVIFGLFSEKFTSISYVLLLSGVFLLAYMFRLVHLSLSQYLGKLSFLKERDP